jgi:hypothetical protein
VLIIFALSILLAFVYLPIKGFDKIGFSGEELAIIEMTVTLSSFIFTVQSFIIPFLKEKIYDTPKYLRMFKEFRYTEEKIKKEKYRPLRNFNELLGATMFFCIFTPFLLFLRKFNSTFEYSFKNHVNVFLLWLFMVFLFLTIILFVLSLYTSYSNIKDILE